MAQVTVELLQRAARYARFRQESIQDTVALFEEKGVRFCAEGLEAEQGQAQTDAQVLERLAALVDKAGQFFGEGP